ncbi:MAG: ACT domain-containing protein [Nitriliruptorales bacterium]|nr:ACT domain-containing protein [Nitriliruptorales bacterium]
MSVTRTQAELSVVVPEVALPEGVEAERGWRLLKVRGPLEFSLTGVLSSLLQPLADADVPVFAISTYDTDWLLVRGDRLPAALEALRRVGHTAHGA